jgi:hypothetical protein
MRHSILLLAWLALFASACSGEQTNVATISPTAASTITPPPTATATFTPVPTITPTSTSTPEPAWYQAPDPALGVLKYGYAQVTNSRARVYASLPDAVAGNGNFGYLPEYPAYVAYSTTQTEGGRSFYFLPVNYGWMDGADLQLLVPSGFSGLLLTRPVDFRFGWVLADASSVNAAGVPVRSYSRYQVVHEYPAVMQKPGFFALGTDEWLPEEQVALVNPQMPPEAGANVCRFIYVNLGEQTLAVYDGCMLVFATLVSSGANSWTFEGQFTILYKENYGSIRAPEWSTSEYYIQAVPYFMSYAGSFGFHGAYWHDDFGTAASHGCINLSPVDAGWLYGWAVLGERVIISAGE